VSFWLGKFKVQRQGDHTTTATDTCGKGMEIDLENLSQGYLNELSKDELVEIIKQLVDENKSYRKQTHLYETQKKAEAGAKVEFGSFGSSNVMFLSSETDNERSLKTGEYNGESQSQRASGSSFGINVTDHRTLFKRSVILEYEADSPAFRKKIEMMVGIYPFYL
jgi:hypothetical protein